ncbi:MAG: hypothetical protein R3F61_17620 [Myxococcota bacterium]
MKQVLGVVVLASLGCAGLPQIGAPTDLTGCDAYIDHGTMPTWSPDQVVLGNADAMRDEELDCYMGVFHPDSAQITASFLQTAGVFETYDLEAKFEGPLAVEMVGSDEALVTFTQLTWNNNNEPFTPARARGVHTMKKNEEGRWRLLQSVFTHREEWVQTP